MQRTPRDMLSLLLGSQRQRFSDSALDGLLGRSRRDLATRGVAIQQLDVLSVDAGQQEVTLASDHLATLAVQVGEWAVSLRLYDTNGTAWWLGVTSLREVVVSSAQPPGLILGGTATYTSLRLTDSDSVQWYLSISTLGDDGLSTSAPTGTALTSTIQLRDELGSPWYVGAATIGEVTLQRTGTALLAASTPVEPRALTYVVPEAFGRLDARDTPAMPRQFTTYPPNTLWLYPVPDKKYQFHHYTFANRDALPDAWTLPLLLGGLALARPRSPDLASGSLTVGSGGALGVAKTRGQDQEGAQFARAWLTKDLARLTPRYFPGDRDDLARYVLPYTTGQQEES